MQTESSPKVFGILAEFETPDALVDAVRKARSAGYAKMDAYTPYPVEGLAEELHFHKTRVPWLMLLGGAIGLVGGYFLQYYTAVYVYPLNVGGRPLNSWPLFIPVTYECIILFGALFGAFGMLALNGFPMPYHPLFNVPGFDRATRDRFFLCIEASDPKFKLDETGQFMQGLSPLTVNEVPE